MAKFFGTIGYGEAVETPPGAGVWVDQIVTQKYMGEVVRQSSNLDPGEGLNANVSVGNSISIIADKLAVENFQKIKFINWNGVLWTVSKVTVQHPRLILDLGEVYNGPTA